MSFTGRNRGVVSIFIVVVMLLQSELVVAERIKDLVTFNGVRSNQLIGYGLVVGLDGSGDQTTQTPFTIQAVKNMLAKLGVVITGIRDPQLKNVAAVMVHAELPPFSRPGQTIDVTVSSLGNAKSLRGGALLMTPLKGADGQLYAMAQGNLIISGFGAEGADGSSVAVNVSNSGRIPNGATVERAVPSPFSQEAKLVMSLNSPDFTTAMRMAESINDSLGPDVARALDSATIEIDAPLESAKKVAFVSVVENLSVKPGSAPARVIINSRSGTVVIGSEVRLLPAAVAHGNLTVSISENWEASQPAPFARRGKTVVTPDSTVSVEQEGRMFYIDPGVTLKDLVAAVNRVGAAPGDLVAILEALEKAGALRAELVVI
ncbi:MAG: flagellar biosynthesis protein FlgI [Gammaproteobacteria bacterium]|nr:MAG: flagellar biosynthesis protein FlgI [Gammaproteobacteria bacterium]RLA57985.1 MAG: flagellar biosynthesis protein FlgI [Gammaproteobacteria bacterium]